MLHEVIHRTTNLDFSHMLIIYLNIKMLCTFLASVFSRRKTEECI